MIIPRVRSTLIARFVLGVMLSILLVHAPIARAEDPPPTLEAQVDQKKIALDDSITLTLHVNTIQDVGTPTIPTAVRDAFDILSQGKASAVRFVNGSLSTETTYTYLLTPKREGVFALGPFTLTLGNQTVETDPITVVVGEGNRSGNTPAPTPSGPPDPNTLPAPFANDPTLPPAGTLPAQAGAPFFAEAAISDDSLYVNQQLLYTIRFYTSVRVNEARLSLPAFDGFFQAEVSNDKQYDRVLAGKTYRVTEKTFILFPSKVGTLTIAPTEINLAIPKASSIDPFFSGGLFQSQRNEAKTVRTAPVTVTVSPLPTPEPLDFSNLVGTFALAVQTDRTTLDANQSLTVTLDLTGRGNIADAILPTWNLPPSFKQYPDQPETTTEKTSSGLQGRKRFRIALVPQQPGVFTLPPLTLSTFNPETGAYETLSSQAIDVTVTGISQPSNTGPSSTSSPSIGTQKPPSSSGTDLHAASTQAPPPFIPITILRPPFMDLAGIAERPRPLLIAILALPGVLALIAVLLHDVFERRKKNGHKRRRSAALKIALRDLKKLKKTGAALAVHPTPRNAIDDAMRAVQDYVASKQEKEGGLSLTTHDILAWFVTKGIDTQPIQTVLIAFDHARYGGKPLDGKTTEAHLVDLIAFLETHDARL